MDEILVRMVGAHCLHHTRPEHLAFVGAAVKMRGYRSFSNYISRAKEAHVAAGHTWTHGTNWKQHKVYVTRGQGPRCPLRAWLGWIWDSKHYATVV